MLLEKLEAVHRKFDDIERQLADPDTSGDQKRVATLSKERRVLVPIEAAYQKYSRLTRDLEGAREVLRDTRDPEMRTMAEEEMHGLEEQLASYEEEVKY